MSERAKASATLILIALLIAASAGAWVERIIEGCRP